MSFRATHFFAALALVALSLPTLNTVKAADATTILYADKFGVVGDGKMDDNPAVLRMLDAAAKITNRVELKFASHKTYFLKTGRGRYAFPLDNVAGLTLDGGGSIFLIDSQQRFLQLTNSRVITIRNMKVDYSPLPFADGVAIGKNKSEGWFDVKIDDDEPLPPIGGPTLQDHEQTFFCTLWHPGVYNTSKDSYLTREFCEIGELLEVTNAERIVRVMAKQKNDGFFDHIELGQWRVSVPVRGIAHRMGPGPSCDIIHNQNVTFENIEMWSAPWFAFGVIDNEGQLNFRNVNVRPKPRTKRTMSSWRDGFHVKNNRASIAWTDCTLQGMGDDAFNLSCHASTVREVKSPTRIVISQNFPLGIADMGPGDFLAAYDETRGVLLGRAKIVSVLKSATISLDPAVIPPAPIFDLELAAPIPGVEAGKTLIWNESTANPHNLIRDCRIDVSCRFRSPVTIQHSKVNTFMWFTGDDLEAPIPRDIVVKDSVLRLGQGNPRLSVLLEGPNFNGKRPTAPVIFNVRFENNKISGGFSVRDAADVVLQGNEFIDAKRPLEFHNVQNVLLRDNLRGGGLINDLKNIVAPTNDAAQITISNNRR